MIPGQVSLGKSLGVLGAAGAEGGGVIHLLSRGYRLRVLRCCAIITVTCDVDSVVDSIWCD